jgi:hypothetical protein
MKSKILEDIARREVGKSGSPYVFITQNGVVRAVFTGGRADIDRAIETAETLTGEVVVEDSTGVRWENQASLARQREED